MIQKHFCQLVAKATFIILIQFNVLKYLKLNWNKNWNNKNYN